MRKIYNAECLFDVTKTKLPPKVRTYEKSPAIKIENGKILDQIDLYFYYEILEIKYIIKNIFLKFQKILYNTSTNLLFSKKLIWKLL